MKLDELEALYKQQRKRWTEEHRIRVCLAVMFGPAKWISWPNWPACICMSGAQAGRARRLRVKVTRMCRFGNETERWATSATLHT